MLSETRTGAGQHAGSRMVHQHWSYCRTGAERNGEFSSDAIGHV